MGQLNNIIQESQDGNIADMYHNVSKIMAKKIINNIEARRANISSGLLEEKNKIGHDGSCDEVHPDKSHKEWEEGISNESKGDCGCGCKESVIIKKLQNSYTRKRSVDININEDVLHVTPDVARNIINLHDDLSMGNQKELRKMISSDIKTFAKIAKFAGERN